MCSRLHGQLLKSRLKGSGPEKELNDVSFVRLKPIELNSRHRSKIQPIYMRRIDELLLELLIISNRTAHERRPNALQHFVLRTLDHAHKWKHKLGVRKL